MDISNETPAGGISGLDTADSNLSILTNVCARELLGAFGLRGGGEKLLTPAARLLVRNLAEQAMEYDRLVGEGGLGHGGSWAMETMVGKASVSGEGSVPETGPVMIVSNHPGLSDTIALFSAIPREDLMVIAARRDFLDALPNTSERLFVLDGGGGGSKVIRAAARHMKRGGALLNFPGGKIEPDPATMDGATDSLGGWSGSIDLFARLVPGLAVVPAIVSGVVSRGAMRNPVSYIRRREEDRKWLAATLQMMFPAFHSARVRVDFGRPVKGGSGSVSGEVIRRAERLISVH